MIWYDIAFIIGIIGLIMLIVGIITEDGAPLMAIAIFWWIIAYIILFIVYIIAWAIWIVADYLGVSGWLIVAFLIVLIIVVSIIRK